MACEKEVLTVTLPRFNHATWTRRVTTNIGSRLRLKFSISKFNLGVMSIKDNSCRYPRDVVHFIRDDFDQHHIDQLIEHYNDTVTLDHIKATFKKWPDIKDDAAFTAVLQTYLTQLRHMFCLAIERGVLVHSTHTTNNAAHNVHNRQRFTPNVCFKRLRAVNIQFVESSGADSAEDATSSSISSPSYSGTKRLWSPSEEEKAKDAPGDGKRRKLALCGAYQFLETGTNKTKTDLTNSVMSHDQLVECAIGSIAREDAYDQRSVRSCMSKLSSNDMSVDAINQRCEALKKQLDDILMLELVIDRLRAKQENY